MRIQLLAVVQFAVALYATRRGAVTLIWPHEGDACGTPSSQNEQEPIVPTSRRKAARISMTGSIAANPHEGSRSEYLAQFVFSSFGTAIPVPHQEDSGIDIYCTLLERRENLTRTLSPFMES